jgi:AcrR family transcriptional regulator
MQEICARARISPGALYRYFESKDDIIAMLAEAERRANDELISYLTSKQDITRALRDALPDIVKEMTRPSVARLTLEIIAEAARNDAMSGPFLEGENAFKSQLVSLLDAGKAGGYVEETLDTAAFVHLFVNLLDSLSVSYAFPVKATRKSLVRSLDHILYRSLTPQGRLK